MQGKNAKKKSPAAPGAAPLDGNALCVDRARRRWEDAAAVALILLAAVFGCNQIWDSDAFWHLRSGQWMLQNHAVLGHDPFSVEGDGPGRWVNVHWLFQVVAACFHAAAGFPGLVVLKMLGFAAAIAVPALWLRRRISPAWLLLTGIWIILCIENRVRIRPETFTFVLLGLTLVLVESVRQGGSPRRLWWLVPVNALWVNMHGLFFIGPMTAVLALAGAFLDKRLNRPTAGNLAKWSALLPVLVSLAACFITPWPAEAPFHPLILKSRVSGETLQYVYGVSELYPTYKNDSLRQIFSSLPMLLAALLALKLLAVFRERWRTLPTGHMLWYLAFIAMAAAVVRNVALFVVPAGFMLAVHGGDWLKRAGELWPKARRLMVPATCLLLAGAAGLAGLVGTEAYYRWMHRREIRFGLGLSYGVQPVELAKYLGSLDVDGDILPLDFGEGGTYICYSWPRHKVWMDGRLEVHSLQRFDQLYEIRTKMRREDQARDPSITPLPPSVRFITVRASDTVRLQALSKCPRFQLLYVDPASVCFARIPQPGEQVTWSAKDKLPQGNLESLEGSFPGGVIKPLLSQYQPRTWLRQNATEWHYIYGNMFSCLGLDRLAVRYLTAAMQLEDWVNPLDVRGQLAQSYQRLCESQQLQLDLDLPIDPYLSRALALYNGMGLADLDSEQAQAYALVQIRSYILGGQIDAGEKAMTDYLDRLPIPLRWTPPIQAEDIRNDLQAALRRALQSLESLRRQTDDFRGLDPAMQAHLLLGKNFRLIDQAIGVLTRGQASSAGKMLLGDLYLRKGQVAQARKAYAAANPPAQDFRTRTGLCDWAEGDFASAVKNLNEAARAEGDSPLPTLYLGLLQEQLGDNAAAAAALNSYNCADPGRLSSNLVGLLRQMAARLKMAGQDARLNLPSSMLQEH